MADPRHPEFTPVRIIEVALENPIPPLPGPSREQPYAQALLLVRLHDDPVGGFYLDIPSWGLGGDEVAEAIWSTCGSRIRAHLATDERACESPPVRLDGLGAGQSTPRCQEERQRFLKAAPAISVVIPTRERPERLRTCIESILRSEYPTRLIQIVVADNAPVTDDTRTLAQDLDDTTEGRVSYIREDARGSASARNRGLELVDTEVVAMTDDDVIVDKHWLTEIARTFAQYPAAGAVSGLLWPAELESAAQIWFEQYGGFSRGFKRRVFDLGENRPADEPLYPWTAGLFGTGNNFSFRTRVLREIGGFDPGLGNGTPALGGVDSEVLLRTILSDYQIIYEPRALAHHLHRADYDGLRRQVYAYGVGLVAYYLKTILAEPRFARDFARKIPSGIRWMLSPDAHINKHKLDDYPSELTWIERRGMLYGPLAYARSRRRYGPHPVYGKRTIARQRV
jgi:GT2 family glycosyltransferase